MATCRECLHWDKCFKRNGTRYYGNDVACNNVEILCEWFMSKTQHPQQKWIPVTERLPERDDVIIAFYGTMRGTSAEIQIHKAWAMSNTCTHWMPLPQPPKEGE